MKKFFGKLSSGESTWLYTITNGKITMNVSDLGATIVNLLVPDKNGKYEDVVLGYDNPQGYVDGSCYLGAIVGRNANRIKGSTFRIGTSEYSMIPNEKANNLHSGPQYWHLRLWQVLEETENGITFYLHSPDGDQGFPGDADISVKYFLDEDNGLHITYDAVASKDTIFNMTNHSYFNLAGHENTGAAMNQVLMLNADIFTPADSESIPTGELQNVSNTPMDFRIPKPIGRDINDDYTPLNFQGGYDHNFILSENVAAVLSDPASGRTMSVWTDLPGIQFYAGNFLSAKGKCGVYYGKRSAIALETQYFPDAIHHSQWKQPVFSAGQHYHTETIYRFGVQQDNQVQI